MKSPPPPSRGLRQAVVLAAFGVLLLLPPIVSGAVLLGAAATIAGVRITRRVAARRADATLAARSAVVLGTDDIGRGAILTDRELSAHGLILGASGAGKSTTLLRILTEQIERGESVVAIDMKGSPAFARVLDEAAGAAGRPFKLWSIDGPGHWNPLQYGNATELKDKLMATERFTEPHYQRAAERYVQMVLQVLARAHPGPPPALAEVVDLMDPRRLPTVLRRLDRSTRERAQDYLAGLTHDQLSAVRGLQTRLAVLTESHTAPYLSASPGQSRDGPTIDLRGALQGPDVVVFSLNSSRYGRLASQIGTLVVQDLVAASGDRLVDAARGIEQHATIGIDEFSALGADHVVALLARGRESGMSVLVATQELADLERAGFGLRDQVIGVTAIKLVHRQEVPSSAQMVAQMAGTERVWEETRQIGGHLLGRHPTGRGTRREVEQFVIHPNRIKNLRTGEAILISKIEGRPPGRVWVNPPAVVADPGRSERPAPPYEPLARHSSARPAAGYEPSARHNSARPALRHELPAPGTPVKPSARHEPSAPGTSSRRTPQRDPGSADLGL